MLLSPARSGKRLACQLRMPASEPLAATEEASGDEERDVRQESGQPIPPLDGIAARFRALARRPAVRVCLVATFASLVLAAWRARVPGPVLGLLLAVGLAG